MGIGKGGEKKQVSMNNITTEKLTEWLAKTDAQLAELDALTDRLRENRERIDKNLREIADEQREIAETLRKQPKWLSEALNSGDGVYRP
jgi:uncharacterized HAD superfamily protein